jgi:hypothetical protein
MQLLKFQTGDTIMEAGMEVEAGIQEVEMEVEVLLLMSAWVMEVGVISEMVEVISEPLLWAQAGS